MPFSVLFASYAPFGLVQAPLFIWLAAVGLFVVTLGVLLWLGYLVRRERRLYERITQDLRAIKSKYNADLRNGLLLAGYDEIEQCFATTRLAPTWDIFTAQFVKRYDDTGADRFWTSESAETVFNEPSVLESQLNRNLFTAIPGMVTGFGLLCTFLAILFALLDVKLGGPTNKQFTGLDKLVSGLSGKFLSPSLPYLLPLSFCSVKKCCYIISRKPYVIW